MTRVRKDVLATALTALVVVVFAATHEGWGVPLVGGSHRWATGAIMLLGIGTCAQGKASRDVLTKASALLGALALGLGVLALVTGSLTPLSFLVVDIVLLWALSTVRHARGDSHRPLAI
jgi:hypothetical protein